MCSLTAAVTAALSENGVRMAHATLLDGRYQLLVEVRIPYDHGSHHAITAIGWLRVCWRSPRSVVVSLHARCAQNHKHSKTSTGGAVLNACTPQGRCHPLLAVLEKPLEVFKSGWLGGNPLVLPVVLP